MKLNLMTRLFYSKTTGQYRSMKGTVVETIGNMTGSEAWQKSGRDEHAQGEAEYNAAQTKGFTQGVQDRLVGKKDAVVGAVTGDKQQQTAGESRSKRFRVHMLTALSTGNIRHDKGQAQQNINDPTQ